MQYSDYSSESSQTGILPNVLFAMLSISNGADFNSIVNRICDKSMMGVTLEWKDSKAIFKGSPDAILGYCMRSGLVRSKVAYDKETGIRGVWFYTYSWVGGPIEEMKKHIFESFKD